MGKIYLPWKAKVLGIVICGGFLSLGTIACSNTEITAVESSSPAAEETANASVSPSPSPQESPSAEEQSQGEDNYQRAIDVATGATSIGKAAVSRDDWSLAASQWEEAVGLLKKVPPSNPDHAKAQEKLVLYERFLSEAKEKAAPPPATEEAAPTSANPDFFMVPIKSRYRGIPIIEVTFNKEFTFDMAFDTGATNTLITSGMANVMQLKQVSVSSVMVADGAVVPLPVMNVDTIEIDGRVQRNVSVAVANMPIGLLGQEFFAGYDVNIKKNVIEFKRR